MSNKITSRLVSNDDENDKQLFIEIECHGAYTVERIGNECMKYEEQFIYLPEIKLKKNKKKTRKNIMFLDFVYFSRKYLPLDTQIRIRKNIQMHLDISNKRLLTLGDLSVHPDRKFASAF